MANAYFFRASSYRPSSSSRSPHNASALAECMGSPLRSTLFMISSAFAVFLSWCCLYAATSNGRTLSRTYSAAFIIALSKEASSGMEALSRMETLSGMEALSRGILTGASLSTRVTTCQRPSTVKVTSLFTCGTPIPRALRKTPTKVRVESLKPGTSTSKSRGAPPHYCRILYATPTT